MLKECLLGAAVIAGLFGPAAGAATAGELATAVVQSPGAGESASFDGVVEAVRQTVVSAQVSGRGRRHRREGRRCRQGRPGAGADRRAGGGTERRRQRRAGPVGARHAGSGDQGIRPPEAAVREEVHEPGRARARRSAIQGHAGAGFGAARPGGRGARPIRLLRRQGALWRRGRRGSGDARRHGDAGPPAADDLRSRRAARHRCGSADRHRADRPGQADRRSSSPGCRPTASGSRPPA